MKHVFRFCYLEKRVIQFKYSDVSYFYNKEFSLIPKPMKVKLRYDFRFKEFTE